VVHILQQGRVKHQKQVWTSSVLKFYDGSLRRARPILPSWLDVSINFSRCAGSAERDYAGELTALRNNRGVRVHCSQPNGPNPLYPCEDLVDWPRAMGV